MSNMYDEEKKHGTGELAPTHTNIGSERRGSVVSVKDAVFGEITEHGPNYRNVRISRYTDPYQLTFNRLDGEAQSLS